MNKFGPYAMQAPSSPLKRRTRQMFTEIDYKKDGICKGATIRRVHLKSTHIMILVFFFNIIGLKVGHTPNGRSTPKD